MVLGNAVRCDAVLQPQVQVQAAGAGVGVGAGDGAGAGAGGSLPLFHPPSLPSLHLLTCVSVPCPLLSSPPQAQPAKTSAAAKNPDAKWHAVVQMAVTALNKAGGDLEHIGESSTLQDALLEALKRARLLRQEAPPRHHERPLGCDRPSERQHVELRLPARHQVASLTLAKKRAPPHKAAGTTFLIEPLRPIPPGACAGAHGTNTRTAPWPPNLPTTSLAFGWSRTEELITDNLLHPIVGDYNQAMFGRSTTDPTCMCHNALLPFIP